MSFKLLLAALCVVSVSQQASAQTVERTRRGGGVPPAEASQFDYLIGDWTFVATTQDPNVPGGQISGIWKAQRALDGFGIQDEYRAVDPRDGRTRYLGLTIRQFLPELNRWDLRFLNVFAGTWHQQFARKQGDEMHLWWSSQDQRGEFLARVRYYDITDDSFRWEQDRSYDGGRTWTERFLTIEATRDQSQALR